MYFPAALSPICACAERISGVGATGVVQLETRGALFLPREAESIQAQMIETNASIKEDKAGGMSQDQHKACGYRFVLNAGFDKHGGFDSKDIMVLPHYALLQEKYDPTPSLIRITDPPPLATYSPTHPGLSSLQTT